MEQTKLKQILEKHKKWLYGEEGGEEADLRNADLSHLDLKCVDLSLANLRGANLNGTLLQGASFKGADLRCASLSFSTLNGADLNNARLSDADLDSASLRFANLSGADLRRTNLFETDLSCAIGLLDPITYLAEVFDRTEEGYVVYKVFNAVFAPSPKWTIKPGEIITEEVNPCRTNICGCGINVAPLEWVKCSYPGQDIYKLLIKWEWLAGVIVPYNTDGKIRCARAQIVGKV